MADLEANFMHLQLLNESLGRFNENFGAFLYGMNMSAFCVDFPEVSFHTLFATPTSSIFHANAPSPTGTHSPVLRSPQRHLSTYSTGRLALPLPHHHHSWQKHGHGERARRDVHDQRYLFRREPSHE